MHKRTFPAVWMELRLAKDAGTLKVYDRIIGESDRRALEALPDMPIGYTELANVIGYLALEQLLSSETTSEMPDAIPPTPSEIRWAESIIKREAV